MVLCPHVNRYSQHFIFQYLPYQTLSCMELLIISLLHSNNKQNVNTYRSPVSINIICYFCLLLCNNDLDIAYDRTLYFVRRNRISKGKGNLSREVMYVRMYSLCIYIIVYQMAINEIKWLHSMNFNVSPIIINALLSIIQKYHGIDINIQHPF